MERDTVLIVDDDADFRDLVELVVQSLGLRLLPASDCRQGVQLLKRERERVLLVLMDYYLPGMEPLQCSGALKELAGLDLTVVLCTAAVSAPQRAAELGLPQWIGKPFDLETLRRAIRQAQAQAQALAQQAGRGVSSEDRGP